MNPRLERYVRHAQLYGDPRTCFETALEEDDFTAAELARLAGRLRRLAPREYQAGRNGGRVTRKHWPKFSLIDEEKERLVRDLVSDGTPPAEIVRRLRTTRHPLHRVCRPRR